MTDSELVAKKLALIETCVRQLRTLARRDALRTDVREEYQLVDLDIVERVLEHDLDDLPRFVSAIRARIGPA